MESQDDRKILFVVDQEGGKGKSFFADWLVAVKDAIVFDNGKSADIKYGYNGQKMVVFDLVRSSQEHINYEIIELIKNGRYFNTKYQSEMRIYGRDTKVLVLMNQSPDGDKLSKDRFDMFDLFNVQ